MDLFIETKKWAQRSVVHKLLRYVGAFVLSIFHDFINFGKIRINISRQVVFLGHASSSKDVMQPLVSSYGPGAVIVETMEGDHATGERLPQSVIYFLSLLMFPKFLRDCFAASSSERILIGGFLRSILMSYGADAYWKIVLTFCRPTALFVANDHSFETRTAVIAARRRTIPVFYIQHAPVTRHFPPLVFDIAFLEGEHSLQCYKVDTSERVILIGSLKFEKVRHLRNNNVKAKAVGIAGSTFLGREDIYRLIDTIQQNAEGLKIIFRPHPDAVHENWTIPKDVELSDVRKEKVFEFLSRVDIVIGGESGILSEACLMNVFPVMYGRENSEVIAADSYGFIARGLCDLASDEEDVLRIIKRQMKNKEDSVHRATYYYSNCYESFAPDPYDRIVAIVKEYLKDFVQSSVSNAQPRLPHNVTSSSASNLS